MVKKIGDRKEEGIDFGKSKIGPLFDSIFFPTLLSMVFASLFTVADGIFVGQGVGSNALAAINIVSPLFLVTTGIALMFGVGVSVVASIHLSQNNTEEANPLNWKLDDTYAPASQNLGSLWPNEKGELEIQDIGADAQVLPDRGVVVTHAKGQELDEETIKVVGEFFGPAGRPGEDYAFFYSNIKDNVAKRVAAYMANQK